MKDSCWQGDWINKGASVWNAGVFAQTLSFFQPLRLAVVTAICPIVLPSAISHQFSTRAPSDSSLIVPILGHGVYDAFYESSFKDSGLKILSLWRRRNRNICRQVKGRWKLIDIYLLEETAIFLCYVWSWNPMLCGSDSWFTYAGACCLSNSRKILIGCSWKSEKR